jgi:uncharacterized protein (TIGR01777 family)
MKSTSSDERGRVVIAGWSGCVGVSMAERVSEGGYEVVCLTRAPERACGPARAVVWDGRTRGAWTAELEGAVAVVNLAGGEMHGRQTEVGWRALEVSRTESVRVIGDAIHACKRPPAVWIQAGTMTIYGDAGERWCDEEAPVGEGRLARTALAWEAAFAQSPTPLTRRVLLRIGLALGHGSRPLNTLVALTRLFLGGAAGGGGQFMSWIHLTDLTRAFLRAIEDETMEGVYNATGPEPVTNAAFMRELRSVLGRPASLPVPAWAVRCGCWLLRTDPALALTGRRGDPRRLEEAGFTFRFPALGEALRDLFPAGERPDVVNKRTNGGRFDVVSQSPQGYNHRRLGRLHERIRLHPRRGQAA